MSLYQIMQGHDPLPQTILVSPATLEDLVSSLVDLLIEQQLVTTLWVKPATTWNKDIERYQNQGKPETIYWCHTFTGGKPAWAQEKVVSLKIENNPDLEREFFLTVLSPQFSALILAQQQPVSTMPTKLTRRHPTLQLKLLYSFETSLIEKVLQEIKKACPSFIIADLKEESLNHPPQSPTTTFLLNNLFLKQIEKTEALNEPSITAPNKHSLFHDSLLFQEEFISQLNRELRPPLTNMKTALCLLESKYLKRQQRQRYIELLNREWEKQNCLLTGLLELVQLDSISYQQKNIPSNVIDILPGIISTYQPIAQEKNIQLGYKIPSELPLVSCPSLWLKQIILNLLSNNLKFTPSGGKIFVEASAHQANVQITFTDTGTGIATSDIPKIFNSFYQGRPTQCEGETENNGAGLGLTIVKQLLDRCGGSISVSTQVNKGSTFKVLLKTVPDQ